MERVRIELGTRYSLLLTHGIMAFVVGLLLLTFGVGPALARLDHARLVFGVLALLAGVLVHAGTVFRSTTAQLYGMVVLTGLYAVLSGGYVVAMLKAPGSAASLPWEQSVNPAPPYPLPLFAGLALLAAQHARTVWRVRRVDRSRRA